MVEETLFMLVHKADNITLIVITIKFMCQKLQGHHIEELHRLELRKEHCHLFHHIDIDFFEIKTVHRLILQPVNHITLLTNLVNSYKKSLLIY